MDTNLNDNVLMLHGEARYCDDCATGTVFVPIEDDVWLCTACDAAIVLSPFTAAA